MSRLIRDDLHMKSYRQLIGHLLTTRIKQIRLSRCQRLLQWSTAMKVSCLQIKKNVSLLKKFLVNNKTESTQKLPKAQKMLFQGFDVVTIQLL